MIWFTADHHFGHTNIKKYENRPDNWVDIAINHWNEVVADDDFVVHLGDFALSKIDYAKMICDELKGTKIIILGNHDRGKNAMREIGFLDALGSRKRAKYGDNQFWQKFQEPESFLDNYQSNFAWYLALSHAPLKELPQDCRFNLHGHIHSNPYPAEIGQKPWHVHVGVDVRDYYPVSLEEIWKIK